MQIVNDLTLVPANTADFSNFDGLRVEDWTRPSHRPHWPEPPPEPHSQPDLCQSGVFGPGDSVE